jgi:hypothetical protein
VRRKKYKYKKEKLWLREWKAERDGNIMGRMMGLWH